MTLLTKLVAVAFMVAIDVAIWRTIRFYDRRGVVFGLPSHTYRERSPRWFQFQMVMLRLSLWLCVAFTIVVSAMLILVVDNA